MDQRQWYAVVLGVITIAVVVTLGLLSTAIQNLLNKRDRQPLRRGSRLLVNVAGPGSSSEDPACPTYCCGGTPGIPTSGIAVQRSPRPSSLHQRRPYDPAYPHVVHLIPPAWPNITSGAGGRERRRPRTQHGLPMIGVRCRPQCLHFRHSPPGSRQSVSRPARRGHSRMRAGISAAWHTYGTQILAHNDVDAGGSSVAPPGHIPSQPSGFIRRAAVSPRRWLRAPDPIRTLRRRGGRPSGRSRRRLRAGQGWRRHRPNPARTRPVPPPSVRPRE